MKVYELYVRLVAKDVYVKGSDNEDRRVKGDERSVKMELEVLILNLK